MPVTTAKAGTAKPAAEAHVLIPSGYNEYLAVPARFASDILPHIRCLKSEGYGTERVFNIDKDREADLQLRVISAEDMTALLVAARLTQTKPEA